MIGMSYQTGGAMRKEFELNGDLIPRYNPSVPADKCLIYQVEGQVHRTELQQLNYHDNLKLTLYSIDASSPYSTRYALWREPPVVPIGWHTVRAGRFNCVLAPLDEQMLFIPRKSFLQWDPVRFAKEDDHFVLYRMTQGRLIPGSPFNMDVFLFYVAEPLTGETRSMTPYRFWTKDSGIKSHPQEPCIKLHYSLDSKEQWNSFYAQEGHYT